METRRVSKRRSWRSRVCLRTSIKEAIEAEAEDWFPLIRKDGEGTGSSGVEAVENREEVASHAGALVDEA